MNFSGFKRTYEAFPQAGINEPLQEPLQAAGYAGSIEGIGIYPTITHHRDGDGRMRVISADRRQTSGHD